MGNDLTLAVKTEYFDQIIAGIKTEEYRLDNEFWQRRLLTKTFDRIVITKGYPRADDASRRVSFPWRGFERREIRHQHFGDAPVAVFAIKLEASQ